jgi:hypothetical protein
VKAMSCGSVRALAAEAEHCVLEPRFANGGESRRVDRPGEIDAAHFGAERVGELRHLDHASSTISGW